MHTGSPLNSLLLSSVVQQTDRKSSSHYRPRRSRSETSLETRYSSLCMPIDTIPLRYTLHKYTRHSSLYVPLFALSCARQRMLISKHHLKPDPYSFTHSYIRKTGIRTFTPDIFPDFSSRMNSSISAEISIINPTSI